MNLIRKSEVKKKKKITILFFIGIITFILMLSLFPKKVSAINVNDDPKNDVYRITALDFLYVIGDEYPDVPDDLDDFTDLISHMVSRSQQVSSHDCIDIRDVKIHHGALNEFIEVDMDGDVDECDYAYILAIIVSHDGNNWIGMSMEYDDGDEEFHYKAKNGIEDNNATGDFTGHIAWMAFNNTGYYYRETDDVVVLSMTGQPDFHDFLQSNVYFDYCPNSVVDEDITTGSYFGDDIITQFLDTIGNFLLGWLFEGALPFLLLILLLLVAGQILLDRLNVYLHWIGFVLLLLCIYPIIMYMISINLVGIMGIPNVFGILELSILGLFIAFIILSIANNFGLFKYYKLPLAFSFMELDIYQIIMIYFYSTAMQIIALVILISSLILIYILLIYSKRHGRNKFA